MSFAINLEALIKHFGSQQALHHAMYRAVYYNEKPSLPNGIDWDEVVCNYHISEISLTYAMTDLIKELQRRPV